MITAAVPPVWVQGQSWCVGADSNAQTVATFLRFYTPNIIGGSLGHHIGEVRPTPLNRVVTPVQ